MDGLAFGWWTRAIDAASPPSTRPISADLGSRRHVAQPCQKKNIYSTLAITNGTVRWEEIHSRHVLRTVPPCNRLPSRVPSIVLCLTVCLDTYHYVGRGEEAPPGWQSCAPTALRTGIFPGITPFSPYSYSADHRSTFKKGQMHNP
jgi:hypothetical protein